MSPRLSILAPFVLGATASLAQVDTNQAAALPKKAWHETISIRGYTQLRYNQIAATNPKLVSEQGDKSIGGTSGFFLRRARLIFTAQPSDMTVVYIQPDLASTPVSGGATHYAQLRDLYADIFLTTDKALRLRLGQSKVPYGFENLQSSQNRLPLDRNDAFNSAVKDERDIGAFLYWAPPEIRTRFKMLVDSGLKGSGDYGVFAFGVYNGQTANQPEANRTLHAVSRITYPFQIYGEQILEASLQGYTGRYVVRTSDNVPGPKEVLDQRGGLSLVYYPQPLGIQAEYNLGVGPALDKKLGSVEKRPVKGGYLLISYRTDKFIPFVRYQTYEGGRKHDINAINHAVEESELGCEWQWDKAIEITASYTKAIRTNPKSPAVREWGQFGRIQVQWNY